MHTRISLSTVFFMKQLVTYNGLVGYELAKARKEKGIEQSDLALKTRISQPALSRLEKGKSSITIDQLYVICKGLEVEPENIIQKANRDVNEILQEKTIDIKTTKEANNNTNAILTGAAIGAILTLLFSR